MGGGVAKNTNSTWTNVELGTWTTWGKPKGSFNDNKAYVNGDGNYHSGLYNNVPLKLTQEIQISFIINQPLHGTDPHKYLYAGIIVSPTTPGTNNSKCKHPLNPNCSKQNNSSLNYTHLNIQ